MLTACGGGSSGGASPNAQSSPGATTSSASPGANVAAQAALLTLSDLPKGWTSKPSAAVGSSTALNTKLAHCLRVSPSVVGGAGDNSVRVNSPDFTPPDESSAAASEVLSIESAGKVGAGFSALSSPRLPRCFDSIAGASFKKEAAQDASSGTKFGKLTGARLKFPLLGEKSAAFGFEIPVSTSGRSIDIFDNLVFIRDGDAIVELTYEDVGAIFDEATAVTIARKAVAKLGAAAIPSV